METPIDTLNIIVGGQTIREMTCMGFLQWVAGKLNGVKTYAPESVELSALISSPPMSRIMADDKKLEIIGKLRKLNVQI